MVRRPEGTVKEHAQGGEGSVEFFHILNEEELEMIALIIHEN